MGEISDMTEAVKELDEALSVEMEPIDDLVVAEPEPSNPHQMPWERITGESKYQWALFSHYRDQGIRRNISATARWSEENNLGTDKITTLKQYRNVVRQFQGRNRWNERCFAYDVEQERLYQLARSEAIRDMAERHEVQIEKAINGLMTPIDALTKAIDEDSEFMADLSKTDKKKLISLANLAARTIPSLMAAERLSRGMPTEIVSGVVEHQHVKVVERDQIGAVLEILGQAGVLNVGIPKSGSPDIIDATVVEVHSVPTESDD
jgi:hypothetical protein